MPNTSFKVGSRLARRVTAGIVLLMAIALPPAAQAQCSGVERVVVVGDIHGDYAGFVEVLRSAEVIDQRCAGSRPGDEKDHGPADGARETGGQGRRESARADRQPRGHELV